MALEIKRAEQQAKDLAELDLLRERLKLEKEGKLLECITICQTPLTLKCCSCSHRKVVMQVCKKRWCPCCARRLAAARATELDFIVARMRWPLFVTLTMRHGSTLLAADVRTLLQAFGKFRRRKIWAERVKGGVASVELTGDAGQWHPHLHCVVDCRWLAIKAREPRPRSSSEEWETACEAAAAELGEAWAKQLGQQTASVRIMRACRDTIAKEVTKYTVKAQDLIQFDGSTGDLIRSIEKTRTLKTFGEAHGKKCKDIRLESKAYAVEKKREWSEAMQQFDCCPAVDFLPEKLAESPRFVEKLQGHRRVGGAQRARLAACAA